MIKVVCLLATLGCVALALPACSTDEPEGVAGAGVVIPENCGRLTTPCPAGGTCEGALDCATGACRDGTCRAVVPGDNVKNGTETDIDCGGDSAPACADGKQCLIAADCRSSVCRNGACQPPSPTDGVKNGDETDQDCGGAIAPKCVTGQGCSDDDDCNLVRCVDTTCSAPSDGDGIKNLDETGIDCGGPTTPKKCPTGQGCVTRDDCDRALCNDTAKTCDPPSPTDAIQNGAETDVDCGGPDGATPRCREKQACELDRDCADFCSAVTRKCVMGRSCKGAVGNATSGIDTCGTGESDEAGRAHESCCHALFMPGSTTTRLDKYEVTAGRFRQFVEGAGPNLRKWASDEIAADTPTGQRLKADLNYVDAATPGLLSYLPDSDAPTVPLNIVVQTGTAMDGRTPSEVQGCYSSAGSSGHATYWWPPEVLAAHFTGHTARKFTKAQYDEKSMNCAPYWLYAAFCAWDGGRMPTFAEITQVWTTTYPWGADFATPPLAPGGPPRAPAAGIDFLDTVNQNNNNLYFYAFPAYGDADDLSGYIAAPGRFPRDATSLKSDGESWMDLGANHMEMSKAFASGGSQFCDFSVGGAPSGGCSYQGAGGVQRATNLPAVRWYGGSWEGHGFGRPFGDYPAQTQYGKTGFRCMR